MHASLEQLRNMLRHADIRFFISDDGNTTLMQFDNSIHPFELILLKDKNTLAVFAKRILNFQPHSRSSGVLFEELLALNADVELCRVCRDPSNGDVDVYYLMPWPEDTITPKAFTAMLDQVADDVRLVIARIANTLASGKTKHCRKLEQSIEDLFSECCDEFARDSDCDWDS